MFTGFSFAFPHFYRFTASSCVRFFCFTNLYILLLHQSIHFLIFTALLRLHVLDSSASPIYTFPHLTALLRLQVLDSSASPIYTFPHFYRFTASSGVRFFCFTNLYISFCRFISGLPLLFLPSGYLFIFLLDRILTHAQ
jgi:hypothetical protein